MGSVQTNPRVARVLKDIDAERIPPDVRRKDTYRKKNQIIYESAARSSPWSAPVSFKQCQ
jgi:hypothetical protein